MTTKTITIAGVEVGIAYCYATEITFKKYTGISIDDLIKSLSDGTNIDVERILYLILSAIMPYYLSKGKESPVKDEDLMYKAEPKELIEAVNAVMQLRNEWYKVPADEPKEESDGEKPKND